MPSVVPQTPFNEYTGNGVATVFPYEFELLAASDLVVTLDGVETGDFTLLGVGVQSGGTVTFATPPADQVAVLLNRDIPLARDTDYQYNGDLLESTVDRDFDRIWMVLQGFLVRIGAVLRLPFPEQTPELPNAATRANKLLGFDAFGNVMVIVAAAQSATALAMALAAQTGASLIGFIQAGANAILRTVRDKLRDTVHVNDWGGDLKKALTDVGPYTTILLDAVNYDITGLFKTTTGDGVWLGNTKPGIRLQGAGMGRRSANGRFMEGGTIVQGTLFNLADDFETYDLSVDVGADVVDNLYAGIYHEGFIPGCNIIYPTPATTIKGVKVDRVSSLAKEPVIDDTPTFMHSMLFENLEDCSVGVVDACGGYHTFVSKVVGLQVASLTARGGSQGEAVIFKSDPANRCEQNEIGVLRICGYDLEGVLQPAGPLRYEALATGDHANTTDTVKIGVAIIRDTPSDSVVMNSTGICQNIGIGHLDVNTVAAACAVRLGVNSAVMQRFTIGTFNIVTGARAFDMGPDCTDSHMGSGVITVTGDGNVPIITTNHPSQSHGRMAILLQVAQTYPVMLQRNAGQFNMDLIEFGGAAAIPSTRFISSFPGTLTLNATNFVDSANASFGVSGAIYQPYKVRLKGAVKVVLVGTGTSIGTVAPPPLKVRRYPVCTERAGAVIASFIQIDTAGVITLLGTSTLNDLVFLDAVEFDALVQ